jgi:hypothetical protein
MDFVSDDKHGHVAYDATEYRYYNPESEPKIGLKKGI